MNGRETFRCSFVVLSVGRHLSPALAVQTLNSGLPPPHTKSGVFFVPSLGCHSASLRQLWSVLPGRLCAGLLSELFVGGGFALPGELLLSVATKVAKSACPSIRPGAFAPGSFAPSSLRGVGIDGPSLARQCLSPHPCGSPLSTTIALSRIGKGRFARLNLGWIHVGRVSRCAA